MFLLYDLNPTLQPSTHNPQPNSPTKILISPIRYISTLQFYLLLYHDLTKDTKLDKHIKLITMKTQKEQSGLTEQVSIDNSQLEVKFKDGKLTYMGILNSNGEIQLHASEMSLIDEIKILIRKLWN